MDPRSILVRHTAVLGLVAAGCGFCAMAARPATSPVRAVKVTPVALARPTLVVPTVVGSAFVFAKGALTDGGFAWRVTGPVHGYAANMVVKQTPAGGTRVIDTGTPLITVRLVRNPKYAQAGTPEDSSDLAPTRLVLAPASSR